MEIIGHDNIEEVIKEVDVLYVTRIQRERFPDSTSYFNIASSYRITPELLTGANKHLIVLHPLPRVDESTPGSMPRPMPATSSSRRTGYP